MQLPLRRLRSLGGLGFELPVVDSGGGGGFFSSFFDVLGTAAEATPQILPAVTPYFQQGDPRQSQYQWKIPALQMPAAAATPAPAPVVAGDTFSGASVLWLAVALLLGVVIAKA